MHDTSRTERFKHFMGTPWVEGALLFLVSLVLYLVGNGAFSFIQRDESGYAARASRMWDTGQWLIPELLGEKYIDKPILLFWIQAPVLGWLGDSTFAARLPAAVAGALAVMLTYFFGRELVYYGAPARWQAPQAPPLRRLQRLVGGLAAILLGSSLLFVFISKWATSDSLLLLLTLGMVRLIFLLLFHRPNRSRRADGRMPSAWDYPVTWWRAFSLAGLAAISVLLKGPANLTFLVPMGVAILVLFRPWRALLPWRMWFWPVLFGLGLIAPYFWMVSQATKGEFANRFLFQQVLQRLFIADNGHFGPPGYYTLASVLSFYPWAMLYIWALAGPLIVVWRVWRQRRANRQAQKAVSATSVPVSPSELAKSGLLARIHTVPDKIPISLRSSSDTLVPSPIAGLDSVVVFLACYFVPGWLFIELIMITKLPHYILPALPALALLLAWRLVDWMVIRRTPLGNDQALLSTREWAIGEGPSGIWNAASGTEKPQEASLGEKPGAVEEGETTLSLAAFFGNVHLHRLAWISTLLPLLIVAVVGGVMVWQEQWLAVGGCVLVGMVSIWITLALWPQVQAGEPIRGIVRTVPLMVVGMMITYLFILPGFEAFRLEVLVARKIREITPAGQPVLLVNWKTWDNPFYTQRPTEFARTMFGIKQGGPSLKALHEYLCQRNRTHPLTVLMDADTRDLISNTPEFAERHPELAPIRPEWITVEGYEHAGVNLTKGWKRTLWLTVLPGETEGK